MACRGLAWQFLRGARAFSHEWFFDLVRWGEEAHSRGLKNSETNSSQATPLYRQTQAPSANVKGANDRIAVGVVGLGPCGAFNAHLRIIYSKRKEAAARRFFPVLTFGRLSDRTP